MAATVNAWLTIEGPVDPGLNIVCLASSSIYSILLLLLTESS